MKTVSEQLLDTLRAAHERSRQGFSITDDLARAVNEAEALLATPALGTCDGNHGGPRCVDPECWNDSPPDSDPLKDNQIAALINKVCRLAREFHNHDSLRQRIAQELVPALKATPEPVGEPAHIEVVGEIVATEDGNDVRWSIEGGVDAIPQGMVLLIADRQITDDTGSGEVYTRPAPVEAEPVGEVVAWQRRDRNFVTGEWSEWHEDDDIEEELDPDWAERRPLFTRPAPGVPELVDAMREVLRISDRKHDAWDRAKDAIAAYDAAQAKGEQA